MRLHGRAIALASIVAVVIGADGGTPPATTAAPATATAAGPQDAFTKQWNDLVAAAKAEGAITILGGPEGSQQDGGWYDAFGKQYGIKVTFSGGNAADVKARV